jgi:hypothetical protein
MSDANEGQAVNVDPVMEMARDIALARTGRISRANEIIENGEHVWHDEIFEWAKDLIAAGWSKSA